MDDKQKLIDSFVRNPTTYAIELSDNSMIKKEAASSLKHYELTIRPPSLHVLSLCAEILSEIPDKITESKDVSLEEAMEYRHQIIKVLLILAFGKTDYESWHAELLDKNLSSIELLQIMQETALKCSPDFFLTSIQIAKVKNPMMMINQKKNLNLTPMDS